MKTSDNYDLQILNHIAENPDTTQVDLATQLGVAVGSVNWYVKRLINKGYVKVTQMQRRRLRYLLTSQGISEQTRLTKEFIQMSLKWYRLTREDTKKYLVEIKQARYDMVCIEGDGDLAEIIYLTCLEAGVTVNETLNPAYPILKIKNWRTVLIWPEEQSGQTLQTNIEEST